MNPSFAGWSASNHRSNGQHWTSVVQPSSLESQVGRSIEEEKKDALKPVGMDLLLAPRIYNSSECDDNDAERSIDSCETMRALSDEDDDEDLNPVSVVMTMGPMEHERYSISIDDLELSIESLQLLAQQQGLDTAPLNLWRVLHEKSLSDPEQHEYHSVRDAFRAYIHSMLGVIPREDIYYLAILRKKLAETKLPLVDGPISVLALGSIIPEKSFYTSKKLFPIGYETLVKVQLFRPATVAFRLRCKIVHGNKKQSPIFVVELERSAVEIVFRSYVASKAWKKALDHFVSLPAGELVALVSGSTYAAEFDDHGEPLYALTYASGEDGFGLLRRNITRVLEGLHRVFWCKEYRFWEQRHPITPNVHAKLRSRLRKQMKDHILSQSMVSGDAINCLLASEVLLREHCLDSDGKERREEQKEKEQREADKRCVREAARKLMEDELKAQEDAKVAQQRAKEEHKNAILEARMEATRQKAVRKEALRLAKEEEKRLREEEKLAKRAVREEEKRKKTEEKESLMKRRIEELRQRRQMREEQKVILENGVVTSVSSKQGSDVRKRNITPDAQTIKQHHLALLKFVCDERGRRRQIRLWDKRNEVENEVWTRVKARYREKLSRERTLVKDRHCEGTKFPYQVISPAVELDAVPSEFHADLLFVWDFISTFSNCFKLTALPSLGVFVNMMTLNDDSSPVGDGDLDDDSIGTLFASLHAELLKVLVSEYFPLLQLGNTLEDFNRTRPMNIFSWPEVARQVCQMAIKFKHPSADEQLLKLVKGSKSHRDDAVTHSLRQKLHRRGSCLLKGVSFEEIDETVEGESVDVHVANLASELNNASTKSSEYYGVVLIGGVSSKFKVGKNEKHLVVTEIFATCEDTVAIDGETAGSPDAKVKDDNADRIRVGDYVMCLNGHDVREWSLDDFNSLINGLPSPHGLLMSSIVPVVKNAVKHITTTRGATKMKCCGFVLKLLRAKKIAAPFNQPVDADLYPDYYSSGDILEPMDLGTILEKIGDDDYEPDDVESFVDDVQLVWKNCYTYNSLEAEISNLAQKLSVIFERLMNEWVYTTENRPLIAAEEDNCRNCQTIYAKGRLLLCDRCDAPYHTFCLHSPLSVVPTCEWFCPTCLANPSFSPEQSRKEALNFATDLRCSSGEVKNDVFTDLEKRLLSAIDILSEENYAKLEIGDRLKVLRILCDLIQETSVVQSLYQSLEDKANDARIALGASWADEWDRFSPPHLSHGVDQTKTFIVDGNEHVLTDELLAYLEDKATAELNSKPIPVLPKVASENRHEETLSIKKEFICSDAEEDEDTFESLEADEEMIYEEFGDHFLVASSHSIKVDAIEEEIGLTLLRPLCSFCGLEDGILNGPLHCCKQSPLTGHTTLLDQFEIPDLLSEDRPDMLVVRILRADDVATMVLEDTAEGVQYSDFFAHDHKVDIDKLDNQKIGAKKFVYAINDRVVFGMNCTTIQDHLKAASQPVYLYLTSLPGEAVRASVSIVKYHYLSMGLTLASYESFTFVQSYCTQEIGFGELSGLAFPGDVLLMVNDVMMRGKELNEVEARLCADNLVEDAYAVFVRQPSTKMRKASEGWHLKVYDLPSQRVMENAFRAAQVSGPISYEVDFQDGPLGLALALEPRGVVVKSLNDRPNGTLGQASLDGRILRGDLVERVNGTTYGSMSDLSQFTAWLLDFKRPLRIAFSRQPLTGTSQSVTSEQANEKSLANPSLLCEQLGLPSNSTIKTIEIESFPLPFEADNLLNGLGVVALNGLSYCEKPFKQTAPITIAVGDLIVGLNGKSVAGLSWNSLKTLCGEMASTCSVYLHFTPFVRPMTLLQAHESCVGSANKAWSECEFIQPRIEKARELELFLSCLIVPRTVALGKCRNGYTIYRFYSDQHRLFILSPEKKWSVCARREQLLQLIAYLEESSRDSIIALRIKMCLHRFLHADGARLQLQQKLSCCTYSSIDILNEGPFSIEREVLLVMNEDTEKYESFVGYYGRKFFLGSFFSQQDAEKALESAEKLIHSTGCHVVVATDALTLRTCKFPSFLKAPTPKAESLVRRTLSRKYETGSVLDGRGETKPTSISHDVFNIIKRGLRSHKMMLNMEAANIGIYQVGMPQMAVSRLLGDLKSSEFIAAQARNQDAFKRKYFQSENPHGRQMTDSKRTRYAEATAATRVRQQYAPSSGTNPVTFKRSLQALVDQGRAMLAAWNQFAASVTMQTSHGLAYACLASFEEVKKVVTRIVVDPNATCPDLKTFVCLHHAYVMGLVCAMATQALTTSQKTASDSAFVKQVADAFASAILSCVDPSTALRTQALNGFAAAAKKCEPSQRAGNLSIELHNVANFVLMFLRTTRYLSGTSLNDLSSCRPLFTASTPGVKSLPASFVQQVLHLENIRQAFYLKINSFSCEPQSASHQQITSMPLVLQGTTPVQANLTQSNKAGFDNVFVDVEFGFGPLGIVINYSNRGAIVVTEFSNDNGDLIGQAQASGKVQIGDEVFAVNGQRLEAIGMKGFKAAVATSKRPLLVTFRQLSPDTMKAAGETTRIAKVNDATPPFIYPGSGVLQGIAPSLHHQNFMAMNQQRQQPSVYNQQIATMNQSNVRGSQQASTGLMTINASDVSENETFASSAPESFHTMANSIHEHSSSSAPLHKSTGDLSLQFTNPQNFISGPTDHSFPAAPMAAQNHNSKPNINDAVAIVSNTQTPDGWQGEPLIPVEQPFSSGTAQGEMVISSGGNVMPLNPSASPIAFGAPNSLQRNDSVGEYMNLVAGNHPQLPPEDPLQVTNGDVNGTLYRAAGDFETRAPANALHEFELSHDRSTEAVVADVDTESESPSISQVTTPAPSDTDGEPSEADRQRDYAHQLAKLTKASYALQFRDKEGVPSHLATATSRPCAMSAALPSTGTQKGKPPLLTSRPAPRTQIGGKVLRQTEETASRRSSRISRKLTNIADLYDPDMVKAHAKGGTGSGINVETEDLTDGDIGVLSTELLEAFSATIRPLKKTLPRSLRLLGAQLLTTECAIPRNAFRFGRWGRPVRAAWAEMVYACETSAALMEAVVFLEANIDSEWLDPCWKASPLPSAKNAIATATIASAAMRLYSLDDAISYGRMKRGGKRKQRNTLGASPSRAGSPLKSAIISQQAKASESVSNPAELPFVSRLSTGLVALADTMIIKILEAQREKSSTTYAYREAKSRIAAITSLTDDQIEQWIQASAAHQARTAEVASKMQSESSRHPTSKRKHPGAQPSQRLSTSRKRKVQNFGITASTSVATPQDQTHFVELRYFQMKTHQHCFPTGSAQDVTLRSRLEHILDVLLRNELAAAFSSPVNVNEVPGYAKLIKQPMDLGTINLQLRRGFYDQRFELLVHDVNLVWKNCFTFNRLDADISKCANRLRSIFNRLFEQWITDVRPNTPVTCLASEELCRQCGQMNAQERMMLCDSCDAAYHAFCLQPPLSSIPHGDWYCPRCPLKKVNT